MDTSRTVQVIDILVLAVSFINIIMNYCIVFTRNCEFERFSLVPSMCDILLFILPGFLVGMMYLFPSMYRSVFLRHHPYHPNTTTTSDLPHKTTTTSLSPHTATTVSEIGFFPFLLVSNFKVITLMLVVLYSLVCLVNSKCINSHAMTKDSA